MLVSDNFYVIWLVTVTLFLICSVIQNTFNELVPDPYMDEIFHVPQTQKYCNGQFKDWDPKITTFPGLYIFGALHGWAIRLQRYIQPRMEYHGLCDISYLRFTNAIFAALLVPVIMELAEIFFMRINRRRHLDEEEIITRVVLITVACCIFPLNFFYIFMYYTDVGSLLFVAATWLSVLKQQPGMATVYAACAVMFRQTNAVWVAFCLGWGILDSLPIYYTAAAQGKKDDADDTDDDTTTARNNNNNETTLIKELTTAVQQAWDLKYSLIKKYLGLITVLVTFLVFIVGFNQGSIVLGDKDHHQPVQHLVQPLYCALYITILLFPLFWIPTSRESLVLRVVKQVLTNPLSAITLSVLIPIIKNYTLVHPFMLADNRHYIFYIWRKLINYKPWVRYALAPCYMYSLSALWTSLHDAQIKRLYRVVLLIASCLVLVPAHLIEFRYYTVPFMIVLLLIGGTMRKELLMVVVAVFAMMDGLSLYMFLYRPYTWGDGSVARFMW